MHHVLQRQLKHHNFDPDHLTPDLVALCEDISLSYLHAEEDRRLIERSLDLSSQEMAKLNASMAESEAELKMILDTVTEVVGLFSLHATAGGKFLYANKMVLELLGKDKEELIGKTIEEVLPEETFPAKDRAAAYQALLNKERYRFQSTISTPQGPRILSTQVLPILDAKGDVMSFLTVSSDITEEITEKKKLEEEEKKFRSLAENLPDIISRFDRNYRHLYVNPQITKISGIPPEQFIGKTNAELGMPEENNTQWVQAVDKVFSTGQEEFIEFQFNDVKGRKLYFESRILPEKGPEGNVETVLSIAHDITERKDHEQEVENKAKELGQLNNLMVGRELKMMELKKEIKLLKEKLGIAA